MRDFYKCYYEQKMKEELIVLFTLLIVGIANLLMLFRIEKILKGIAKEVNHIEHWKGIPVDTHF